MRFLIIADPLTDLKPASDTGLSLLREALTCGHEVCWATPEDLCLDGNQLWVTATVLESCAPRALPIPLKEHGSMALDSFNGIWIRKDPPFDMGYLSLCWLLSLLEDRISIINSPATLMRYHEKLLPLEAWRAGAIKEEELVPTFLTTGEDLPRRPSFPDGPVISKPWFGYGGHDVEKWSSIEESLDSAFGPGEAFTILQPFLEEIHEQGDRRVLFVEGDYVGDFVRKPAAGSIRANMAQGGSVEQNDMTPQIRDLSERVGGFLKSIGVFLAGADFIGTKLTEINITAPTGFEALVDLGHENPSRIFLERAEAHAETFKR